MAKLALTVLEICQRYLMVTDSVLIRGGRVMRVLVVGNGAREHALAWKLSQSGGAQVSLLGTHPCAGRFATPLVVDAGLSTARLAERIISQSFDLVVVGGETLLADGLGDMLRGRGVNVFGPDKSSALIESSKAWAKELMAEAGVPTAAFVLLDATESSQVRAHEALARQGAIVLKASGLAAGKGVFVCHAPADVDEAFSHFRRPAMAAAAKQVVLEDCMAGRESSYFVVLNTSHSGAGYLPIGSAVDYKRRNEGDEGPNTGGMGGYAPVPWLSEEQERQINALVTEPIVRALRARKLVYRGCLYIGLMWTKTGPMVVEFNCRFGDPEAEILAVADGRDWLPLLAAAAGVKGFDFAALPPPAMEPAVATVLASSDYPFGSAQSAPVGKSYAIPSQMIGGERDASAVVFAAAMKPNGDTFEPGNGRVMVVVGRGESIAKARQHSTDRVEALAKIWPDTHWRRDIGAGVT